ncbi:MAG: hypothetical protein AB7G62_13085 [Magnetospirillum sp.]
MLFVWIDTFLDRFSPVVLSPADSFTDVEIVPDDRSSHSRLVERYFDSARSSRPNQSVGETKC